MLMCLRAVMYLDGLMCLEAGGIVYFLLLQRCVVQTGAAEKSSGKPE